LKRKQTNGQGPLEKEAALKGPADESVEPEGNADLYKWADDKGVFMINVITVPEAESEDFLKRWDKITEYMCRQPGFIRTNLYRRFDNPERWVNVAVFESTDAIRAAFSAEEFERLTEGYPGYRDVGVYARIRSAEHV
jgi:heme-degrading monooxygenase HmoA